MKKDVKKEMEQSLFKVFTGQAIDVKMVKNFLKTNGIKSFAENRNGSDAQNEWAQGGFDPFVDLMVESEDVENAVKLIEDFLNERAD